MLNRCFFPTNLPDPPPPVPEENLWGFLQSRHTSCHLTISVKALNGTENTNLNQYMAWRHRFFSRTPDERRIAPRIPALQKRTSGNNWSQFSQARCRPGNSMHWCPPEKNHLLDLYHGSTNVLLRKGMLHINTGSPVSLHFYPLMQE